ncbi:AMP-binding protein [Enterococcus faecalis]|nr:MULTISPECIES: amino acid adenylation domain-containing protein [Enterococcus]EGO6570139.1 AMP-binding protein [Enterococcus faecalis]EGO7935851.1 AMP-binding protein [Enterococcus faecalis]EGO8278971.1 AMP-binding protein [Enterococcus faecalis]EGO8520729.1 non-ribosomal peptide synthetase [Enterococcus faecalis]EHK9404943.1 AMP-binding protein [Enterococcus faecalis]
MNTKSVLENYNLFLEFEKQAKLFPKKVVIQNSGNGITNEELTGHVQQIASGLCAKGLKKGDVVGVMLEKGDYYPAVLLACLKLGLVFLPLDATHPVNRIKQIVNVSKVRLIVSNKILNNDYIDSLIYSCEVLCALRDKSILMPTVQIEQADPAYIIYTSGTTGYPKGIIGNHAGLHNLVEGMRKVINQTDIETVGVFAPTIFDPSIAQIFFSLLTSNKLIFIQEKLKQNPLNLLEFIKINKVDIIDITPCYLQLVLDSLRFSTYSSFCLPTIISCGEPLPLKLVDNLYSFDSMKNTRIFNFYGPSECSVYSTVLAIDKKKAKNIEKMSIGYPLSGVNIVILNEKAEECDCLVEGEICIYGKNMSNGYVEKELSGQYFVTHPMYPDSLLYKTGDRGYKTKDGMVYYIGRKDDQIKIRGFRIELKEIELKLEEVPRIDRAVVLKINDIGKDKLIAFYLSKQRISENRIHKYLKEKLPDYMIPDHYVSVEEFPLNTNGKIIKKELVNFYNKIKIDYKDEIVLHERTKKLLQEVSSNFSIDLAYVDEDFSSQGINSLDMYRLLMYLQAVYEIDIPFECLAEYNSVKSFLNDIDDQINKKSSKEISLKVTGAPEEVTALPFQKFLLELEKKELKKNQLPNISSYNMVFSIRFNKYIDPSIFKRGIERILQRHAIFSYYFEKDNVNNKVKLLRSKQIASGYLEIHDCKCLKDIHLFSYLQAFFDLNTPCLYQFLLFEDTNEQQMLVLNIHHCIFDYYSLHIFLYELFNSVENTIISEDTGYVNYIESRSNQKNQQSIDYLLEYYKNRKKAVRLIGDLEDQKIKVYSNHFYKEYSFSFGEELLTKVKRACKGMSCTEYMLLFSAFALLIYQYTGKKDFSVGTFLPGRKGTQHYRSIGLMTEMHGIRFKLSRQQQIKEFVKEVKENILNHYPHQQISMQEIFQCMPFDELVKGTLFDIVFNYMSYQKIVVDEYECTIRDHSGIAEGLPLVFVISQYDNELIITIKYNHKMYSSQYIEQLVSDYAVILKKTLINGNLMVVDLQRE